MAHQASTQPYPTTVADARARLEAAALPDALMGVARRLHDAGHEAVVVGGAVRDCLIGRERGDWDLATSATPDEVTALFRKTIPTGIEHGTVTVVHGSGDRRVVTEVTTFRGEGTYADGRRPQEVRFLRDLAEDLARRDFTVNAFAWNPLTRVFTDCFGGLEDLNAGLIRAVGDPVARFGEDGLRAMRAVRFCAALEFRLDPATQAAIGGALEILAKVSRERVRVELFKLLKTRRPHLGLVPMAETGMWPLVLGELDAAARDEAIEAVERTPPDPVVRVARLLWPRGAERTHVESVIEALKPSRDERRRVLTLTEPANAILVESTDAPTLRRHVARMGRGFLEDALAVLAADEGQRALVVGACEHAPLTIGELAVGGRDLVAAGIAKPGKQLGVLLRGLLDWCHDDPRRNTTDELLARARALAASAQD